MKTILLFISISFAALVPATAYTQEPEIPEEIIETEPEILGSFGCILPLTGSYARLGEMALKGVRTAVEHAGSHGEYRIVLKDSGSTAEGASEAFDQIFRESDPKFIIGPLPSNHLSAIENRGSLPGVPIVIFPVFDRTKTRSNIHSYSLPLNSQIKTLSDYSLNELKLKNFGILSPKTKAGSKMSSAFKNYMKRKGGKIVYADEYEPDLSDIDVYVQWMQAFKMDAIFIPDGAENSSYIIKKIISDDDIANLIFLGPNTWNSNVFYSLSKNDFDGVLYKIVFTDFIDTQSRDWKKFSNLYYSLYNERPSTFQFQIYSAAMYFLQKDIKRKDPEAERLTKERITLKPKTMIFTIENGEVIKLK